MDAPLSAAAFRGQQADAALAAALLAAKSEASAAQERVRVAALAWERERATADALALRVAEAERYLHVSSGLPVDPEHGASSHQAPSAGFGARYDPTDPMVAQLHLQAAGVQNIRALVSVLLLRPLAGPGPHTSPLRPRRPRPRRLADREIGRAHV